MTFNSNILSQNDPRWKNLKLGFHATETIGEQGCALTCLAMMATGYAFPETPDHLNNKLKELGPNNGYMSSLMVWSGLTRLYPKIVIKELYVCSDVKPVPLDRVDSLLSYGQTVLVEIDSSMATGEQSHWVLLTEKNDDDYIMLDPLTFPTEEAAKLLVRKYGFGRTIDQLITAVAFYECWKNGKGEPVIPPLPGMFVQVLASTTKGLHIRVQPNTSASIATVEIARTPLLVLEEEGEARSKVGVTDQWIKVRDPQGLEGYVAAWYLEECPMPVVEEVLTPEVELPLPRETLPKQEPPIESVKPIPVPDIINPVLPPRTEISSPDKTPDVIYVSSDVAGRGLRLRAKPNLKAGTVAVLKARQKLAIIEDGNAARVKVGVINQWVNVRTEKGESGYCAAWLLVLPVSQQVAKQASATKVPVLSEVDPLADTQPTPVVKEESSPEEGPASSASSVDQVEKPEFTVIISKNVGKVGLRLRAAPEDGKVLMVMKAGVELTVIEPLEAARSKIGTKKQWLHVKNNKGNEGYIAAWFVEPGKQPMLEIVPDKSLSDMVINVSPVVGSGGLRLRSAPDLKSDIVKKLPPLTQLAVLEPLDAARPKIGMMDQWLNVRTRDGAAGYVAAWYVVS